MLTGPLAQMLAQPDMDMVDAIHSRAQLPGPHTFIVWGRQIDGALVTPDVDIQCACFLPFLFGVGDHRAITLDLPQYTVLL